MYMGYLDCICMRNMYYNVAEYDIYIVSSFFLFRGGRKWNVNSFYIQTQTHTHIHTAPH